MSYYTCKTKAKIPVELNILGPFYHRTFSSMRDTSWTIDLFNTVRKYVHDNHSQVW